MFMSEDEYESPESLAWKVGLIAPEGKRKAQWDWFVLLLVFYTSISVPFQLAFFAFADPENSAFGFAFDILVDLCFITDVFVSWRTTYYDREGVLVTDRKLARRNYTRFWFWIDLVASFPFEYFGMLVTIGMGSVELAWLRLPSLLKLLRILRLGRKIDRLSSSKMFRIAQFTFMLLMAAHWYACLWYFLGGRSEPVNGVIDALPGEEGTSWVFRLDMEDEATTFSYTASLYWAVTTLMKSPWFHPNSPLEFAGATFMIIVGCVLFAYFLGNVTAVITAANAAGGRYRGQVEQLKGFCMSQGISQKMTDKLLKYQDALWTETSNGTDRQMMINAMPRHLLPYVLIGHIYRPLMDACPFLYDCSAWGAVEFLRALKVQVCERGDTLIRAGTLISSMYILVRGEVKIHVVDKMEKELAETYVVGGRIGSKKGDNLSRKSVSAKDAMRGRTDKFGTLLGFQNPLEPMSRREYSVDALSRCSLLMITRPQLKEMLQQFDEDKPHVLKAIENANLQHSVGGRRESRQSVRCSKSDKNITKAVEKDGEGSKDSSPEPFRPGAKKAEAGVTALPTNACNQSDPSFNSGVAPPPQPAPAQTSQNGRGGLLGGLLSPPTGDGASAEVHQLRQEVHHLREQMAYQANTMASQSKMLEQILQHMKLSS